MSIKWTKAALRSVDEIAGYISRESPQRATNFILELVDSANKLQSHPSIGRAGRIPGTRELVLHKHYIAIYRVRGEDVEILRLHHVARESHVKNVP